MSDVQIGIARKVADQLYWDNRISAYNIKVDADDGNVVLTGTAPTNRARRIAEKDALDVSGVVSVDNQIVLEDAVPTDRQIKVDIEQILEDNPDINASSIHVSVDKGAVTLEGSVDAYWKKMIAEELISMMPHVYALFNKLSVVPTKAVNDKIIAATIVDAMDRNKWIDIHWVTVKVEKGIVTLAGKVPNWAAYHGASNAATYTAGVVDVINRLTYQ